MPSQPFIVVFTLSAPVAHGSADRPPFLMLDGLVGYAVAQEMFGPYAFARRRKRDELIELPLPLDSVLPGIYAASQGFAPIAREIATVLTRPYGRATLDPFFVSKANGKNGKITKVTIQAEFAPDLIPISALAAPMMVFFGRGDVMEVERLLRRHIRFLGHKRGAGYGHIVHVDVVPQSTDWSWSRWDNDGVHLHRALPADSEAVSHVLSQQWGANAADWWQQHSAIQPQLRLATAPPYHDPDRQQWCYVPEHYGLVEAAEFLEHWPGFAPWKRSDPIGDLELDEIPDEDEEPMTDESYWPRSTHTKEG